MSEVIPVLNYILNVINFLLVILVIPLIKFLFDLRLKIERIEVILNIILKDVEHLKKEVYNDGKNSKD